MNPLWTARAIANATGGTASADFTVQGVAFDSREVTQGDLFIAMKGEATDGHKFIDKAIAAGAAGIVCESPIDFPHVRVADSAAALNAPGIASRSRRDRKSTELQSLMRISYAVFCLKKKKHIETL